MSLLTCFAALLASFGALSPRLAAAAVPIDRIRLPAGFHITVFSDAVPGARSLARGDAGTIFVGTREEGRVYALVDRDGDGRADQVYPIASGLDLPNGVAFPYCHGGDLPDPDYGRGVDCAKFVPPAQKLGPHVAALGMRFYTGTMFPPSTGARSSSPSMDPGTAAARSATGSR